MAKLQNKTKDNPKLEQRPLKDGRISLYLEYYLGRTETPVVDEDGNPVLYTSGAMAGKPKVKITHNRKKETLPYYLIASPKTPAERQQNKEILELAKRVRYEREEELKENKHGYRLKKEEVEINYLDWMAEYHANYTKSDGNQIRRARTVFIDFLVDPKMKLLPEKVKGNMTKEEKETIQKNNAKKAAEREKKAAGLKVKPEQLTKDLMRSFTEYLIKRFTGEGAHTLYARFKKMILAGGCRRKGYHP